MKIFRTLFTIILVFNFNTIQSYARDILRVKTYPSTGNAVQDAALKTTLDNAVAEVNNGPFGKLGNQNDLAQGFADANIYASKAGNIYAYQNYDNMALMSGITFSVQLPGIYGELFEILIKGNHDSIEEDILENGDPYFGAGAGFSWMNFGYNFDKLIKNLACNIKYGALKTTIKNFSYDFKCIGIEGNYTFIDKKEVYGGLLRWRGLSVGSGLIYNSTNIHFSVNKYTEITQSYDLAEVRIQPGIDLGIENASYTIPVNLVTSLQTLWILNGFLGIGTDINFGNSKIILGSESEIYASYNNIEIPPEQRGELTASGNTKDVGPSLVKLYLMYGLGLNLGPVKIDIQYSFYLFGGYSWGINFGAVF